MRLLSISAQIIALCAVCMIASAESQDDFAKAYFLNLKTLCTAEAYAGRLVTSDLADRDFQEAKIIMGPARCTKDTIDIPLAVAADRSRIWKISKTPTGLRLKHDHTHTDGTKDALTQYGGDSLGQGTHYRQSFSVDAETRALFTRADISVSNQNTWAMDIYPGFSFSYEMWRPERHFRLVFDLSSPVVPPPAPWADTPTD